MKIKMNRLYRHHHHLLLLLLVLDPTLIRKISIDNGQSTYYLLSSQWSMRFWLFWQKKNIKKILIYFASQYQHWMTLNSTKSIHQYNYFAIFPYYIDYYYWSTSKATARWWWWFQSGRINTQKNFFFLNYSMIYWLLIIY